MSRQAAQYERELFEIINDYDGRFYYEGIFKTIEGEGYSIKVDKNKEEMVGYAYVITDDGNRLDYEIRYNRIVNVREGYTLLVPKVKVC